MDQNCGDNHQCRDYNTSKKEFEENKVYPYHINADTFVFSHYI